MFPQRQGLLPGEARRRGLLEIFGLKCAQCHNADNILDLLLKLRRHHSGTAPVCSTRPPARGGRLSG